MKYFIEPLNLVADQMAKDPEYHDRLDAVAELRSLDDGTWHKGNEFRRVASLQGPLLDLARVIEPEFLLDKRKFYAWLDSPAGRMACTYDRRRGARAGGDELFHGFGEGTIYGSSTS